MKKKHSYLACIVKLTMKWIGIAALTGVISALVYGVYLSFFPGPMELTRRGEDGLMTLAVTGCTALVVFGFALLIVGLGTLWDWASENC